MWLQKSHKCRVCLGKLQLQVNFQLLYFFWGSYVPSQGRVLPIPCLEMLVTPQTKCINIIVMRLHLPLESPSLSLLVHNGIKMLDFMAPSQFSSPGWIDSCPHRQMYTRPEEQSHELDQFMSIWLLKYFFSWNTQTGFARTEAEMQHKVNRAI